MRSFSHWTPAYIYHRLADWLYRAIYPGNPWLTPGAVNFLSSHLKPGFSGLEYGSGRSTTWFASQVGHLTSMEHNPEWFNRVSTEIARRGITNISYVHQPKPDNSLSLDEVRTSAYVTDVADVQKDSLDFVLIDGVVRPACALHSIPLLRKGGLLIIDDANHYLPSSSSAPNSRSIEEGPLNTEWQEVERQIHGWESIWFGNGIKETAIFKKPLV